jgi:hypothetical protein
MEVEEEEEEEPRLGVQGGQLSPSMQLGEDEGEDASEEAAGAAGIGVLAPGRVPYTPQTSDTQDEKEGVSSDEDTPEQQGSEAATGDTDSGLQQLQQHQAGTDGAADDDDDDDDEMESEAQEEEEEGGEPGWRPLVLLRNVKHLQHSPGSQQQRLHHHQGPTIQQPQPQPKRGRQQPAAVQPPAVGINSRGASTRGPPAQVLQQPELHRQQARHQQQQHQQPKGARLPKGLGVHRPWERRAALRRGALAAAFMSRLAQEHEGGEAGQGGL